MSKDNILLYVYCKKYSIQLFNTKWLSNVLVAMFIPCDLEKLIMRSKTAPLICTAVFMTVYYGNCKSKLDENHYLLIPPTFIALYLVPKQSDAHY